MIKLDYKPWKIEISAVDSAMKDLFGSDFDGVVFGTKGIYLIFFANESAHAEAATTYWQNLVETEPGNG